MITSDKFFIVCHGASRRVLLTPTGKVKRQATNGLNWYSERLSEGLTDYKIGNIAQLKLNKLDLRDTNNRNVVFWTAVSAAAFVSDYEKGVSEWAEDNEGRTHKRSAKRRLIGMMVNAGLRLPKYINR